MKQRIIRRGKIVLEFEDVMFFHDIFQKSKVIGEVDLVLVRGKLRIMERNMFFEEVNEDYPFLKEIYLKLRPSDFYQAI